MENETTRSAQLLKALDEFDGSKLTAWFTNYGKQIVVAFLTLFALIFLISRWSSGNIVKAEEDYLTAESNFRAFQKNIAQTTDNTSYKEPLAQLQKLLSRHPELHAKYDGAIVQTLLAYQTDIPVALEFGESTLKRTKADRLDSYSEYAKASLLIGQQKYPEALQQATQLKAKLAEKANDNEQTLSVLNLIRIAALQQKLNDKKAELATWKELKTIINSDSASIKEFIQHFTNGQVNLLNYIEAREKILNS